MNGPANGLDALQGWAAIAGLHVAAVGTANSASGFRLAFAAYDAHVDRLVRALDVLSSEAREAICTELEKER